MSEDPATTFFPDVDEIPSLYDVLGVAPDCSDEDLKRAYRRLSLQFHPDKVASSSACSSEADQAKATLRFQQIGFAYAVLKDKARRDKYDLTGSTVEMSAEGAKTEAEWKDYFKELWSGEVSAKSIDELKKKYQGSDEERGDVLAAYESSSGNLDTILSSIMVSTVEDEDRFVDLINQAIASGEIKSTAAWKKHLKDTKGKERRRKKADKEAKEAEELAKELGVHDKLFGGGGKGDGAATTSGKTAKGKGKAKAGKNSADGAEEDGEAALRALIQGNQAKRMNSLVDSLEAKYAAIEASKGKKGGNKKRAGDEAEEGGGGAKRPRGKRAKEPTEEEFAAIQAKVDARRNGGRSK
ncbi:hypothetical protein JCM10908_001202 [Rhodotorula pacifica]|uniref:J domain-containing protein n=1 Tax=Rhodotorula pacifica TaxID=1495444 RepID=UPI00317824DE